MGQSVSASADYSSPNVDIHNYPHKMVKSNSEHFYEEDGKVLKVVPNVLDVVAINSHPFDDFRFIKRIGQ